MAGTIVNLVLLGFLFLVAFLCVVAPLAVLAFMFWNWHKELSEIGRLKQARSTQVR
jgi:uncharacterized metal-binding protein